ncbi:hypothetical protein [Aminipila luticellarii]|uniref:Uncharacterized protein n=1 Tax=Aminipila luticellarii TaxID=2507160 RepID=A0A410PTW1_9FIRM|nr:hypothetical protein [Aminipila luticellarii]QAT42349.1 hypothetical protein EQM06_03380 [Aminipila luticellarii]
MNHSHNQSCCSHNDNGNEMEENGQACGGCCCGHHETTIQLSEEEIEILTELAQTPYLPLAQFVLKSSQSSHLESVALAPVYLHDRNDSMDTVRRTADVLKALEAKGLLTLDYEEPLENGDYTDYSDSTLYAYFKETVMQAKGKENFLFDMADLELGSIALTHIGQIAVENLDKLTDTEN